MSSRRDSSGCLATGFFLLLGAVVIFFGVKLFAPELFASMKQWFKGSSW